MLLSVLLLHLMKYPKGFCFDIIDVLLILQFLPHKNKVEGAVMSSRPIEWACDLPIKRAKILCFIEDGSKLLTAFLIPVLSNPHQP